MIPSSAHPQGPQALSSGPGELRRRGGKIKRRQPGVTVNTREDKRAREGEAPTPFAGPVEGWPLTLQSLVGVVLAARQPMILGGEPSWSPSPTGSGRRSATSSGASATSWTHQRRAPAS